MVEAQTPQCPWSWWMSLLIAAPLSLPKLVEHQCHGNPTMAAPVPAEATEDTAASATEKFKSNTQHHGRISVYLIVHTLFKTNRIHTGCATVCTRMKLHRTKTTIFQIWPQPLPHDIFQLRSGSPRCQWLCCRSSQGSCGGRKSHCLPELMHPTSAACSHQGLQLASTAHLNTSNWQGVNTKNIANNNKNHNMELSPAVRSRLPNFPWPQGPLEARTTASVPL